ncbi:MAG: hypothetical protein JXR76_02715 [Deltaproteobacteria bacterium]|nr:hypothetical protein [Deltaproteobacteria bacterium]
MRFIKGLFLCLLATGCQNFANVEGYNFTDDTGSDTTIDTTSDPISVIGNDTESHWDSATATITTPDTATTTGELPDTTSATSIDTTPDPDTATDTDTGFAPDTTLDTVTPCTPTNNGIELCDNIDNDCDGNVDEDYDLQNNPNQCGGCQNDCTTVPGVWSDFGGQFPPHMKEAKCYRGYCEVAACDTGYKDDPLSSYPDCNLFITQLAPGYGYSCALFSNSSIKCWGTNRNGELGRDTGNQTSGNEPASVDGLPPTVGVTLTAVANGASHTCVHLSNNTIQCWGSNLFGQLGRDTGDELSSAVVEPVVGLPTNSEVTISKIAAGVNPMPIT